MAGFNLAGFTATLGAYMRKWDKTIQFMMFHNIQLENYMTKKSGITDEWISASSSVDEVLQAHQPGWTPKGTVTIKARLNKVRNIKFDITLDDLDELFKTFIGFMADETKKRKDWPFVRFVVEQHILPKIREEIDHNSYNAVYVAPTPGTAGASIETVDGLGTIITNEIAAGNIVPIATGVISGSNILDRVESFIDSLPKKYSNMKAPLLMSSSNARKYYRDYRQNFGGHNSYNGKDNLKVDATNVKIIGIDTMEGSNRFIHTPKYNLEVGFDKVYVPEMMEIETAKRQVNIYGNLKRGYGIKHFEPMFVNDQA